MWPRHSEAAPQRRKLVSWEDDWNADTVKSIYDEVRELHTLIHGWPDAIDNKVVAVFSVVSLVAGLAPKTTTDFPEPHTLGWWLWAAALGAWLVSAIACAAAFFPRSYRVDPDPRNVGLPEWYRLSPSAYQVNRLHDMKATAKQNRAAIHKKSLALKVAIIGGVIEIGLIAAALLFARGS